MKRMGSLVIALICLIIGYALGWISPRINGDEAVQRIVAMSWGDGRYGKAFYGAEVYLEPAANGYSVRGRVWIAHGGDYYHDLGQLGTVTTPAEAVARWGSIQWSDTGLTIGPGNPNPFVFTRAQLESHR